MFAERRVYLTCYSPAADPKPHGEWLATDWPRELRSYNSSVGRFEIGLRVTFAYEKTPKEFYDNGFGGFPSP